MKSQTKAKAEARKVNPGPSQEVQVVLCLLDLGIKFVSFGRRGSANVAVNVLFNTRRNLQLHLPKMISVERARRRRRRRRRRRTRTKNKKKGDRSRSSSRGSNSSRAHRVSRTKGENHLPLAQLPFARCAL